MKFMITIYDNDDSEAAYTGEFHDEHQRIHGEVQEELKASGEFVDSHELSVTDAKVVRVHDGSPAITDGPFTEGRELVGGYYIVDCATMDRALAIASRFIEARFAPIEVRALVGD